MPVPDFQSFFLPLLRQMADGSEHSLSDLRRTLAVDLKLKPEELEEKLPSGKQTTFGNRVAWSSVYLTRAGALQRVRRGVLTITDRGRELLALNGTKLTIKDLSRYPEFVTFHKGDRQGSGETAHEPKSIEAETPEERLASAYKELHSALTDEILEAVRKASPTFFEQLVVDLLVGMGYGGSAEDAGNAVGKSGDGGIDGIVKQDRLGLENVYIQAKRWDAAVGRPVVQTFAGSLDGVRAKKGVLITTSYFSREALEYVQRIEKRIVLVDGRLLAELMVEHGIGVNVVQIYKVQRLDSDYFEAD